MLTRRPLIVTAIGGCLSLIAAVALIIISTDWPMPSPIAGDPTLYGEIASKVLAGGVPYIDVTVEHLPTLLLPILAVGLIANATSTSYAALWPIVTIGAVVATVAVAGRIRLGEEYQQRLALAMLPMLPLIIFRLEIYVVVVVVLAIGALGTSRYRAGAAWTLLGTLGKGWPITLIGIPLRKGHRALALGTFGLATALLAAVAMLPGFQQGRSFDGIHSETIVGNLILVYRHLTGTDLGLIGIAGATYVDAPIAAVVLNASIAIPILVIVVWAVFHTTDTSVLVSVAGIATAGIILLSPLFSAQFMFWLVPFVVLTSSRTRSVYLAAAALSTMVAAFWNPAEAWWAAEVLVRNIAFVTLVIIWVNGVRPSLRAQDAESTSRRNLPV